MEGTKEKAGQIGTHVSQITPLSYRTDEITLVKVHFILPSGAPANT